MLSIWSTLCLSSLAVALISLLLCSHTAFIYLYIFSAVLHMLIIMFLFIPMIICLFINIATEIVNSCSLCDITCDFFLSPFWSLLRSSQEMACPFWLVVKTLSHNLGLLMTWKRSKWNGARNLGRRLVQYFDICYRISFFHSISWKRINALCVSHSLISFIASMIGRHFCW